MPNVRASTTNSTQQVRARRALETAVARHRQGALNEAETAYKQALQLEPDNTQARYLYAMLMFDNGNHWARRRDSATLWPNCPITPMPATAWARH